jgi:hypothetical protein
VDGIPLGLPLLIARARQPGFLGACRVEKDLDLWLLGATGSPTLPYVPLPTLQRIATNLTRTHR